MHFVSKASFPPIFKCCPQIENFLRALTTCGIILDRDLHKSCQNPKSWRKSKHRSYGSMAQKNSALPTVNRHANARPFICTKGKLWKVTRQCQVWRQITGTGIPLHTILTVCLTKTFRQVLHTASITHHTKYCKLSNETRRQRKKQKMVAWLVLVTIIIITYHCYKPKTNATTPPQ